MTPEVISIELISYFFGIFILNKFFTSFISITYKSFFCNLLKASALVLVSIFPLTVSPLLSKALYLNLIKITSLIYRFELRAVLNKTAFSLKLLSDLILIKPFSIVLTGMFRLFLR